MKYARIFAVFLSVCLLLSACGGAASSDRVVTDMDMGYDAAPNEKYEAEDLKSESPELSPSAQTDRKLIRTVSIQAETEHFDDLLITLDGKITALGGYVETRQSGNPSRGSRWCRMTVRIPADRLSEFRVHVDENANVLTISEQTQDVTLQYTDTEAKITALETEQARLLELLAQAGSLYDILEIEARLSDVTYELERYESHKRGYDNQITYATVSLEINEVRTLTPVEDPTVWQRITSGFADSLEGVGDDLVDIFVWFVTSLPYLVVWVPLTALLLWLFRRLRRKMHKKPQSPPSETP